MRHLSFLLLIRVGIIFHLIIFFCGLYLAVCQVSLIWLDKEQLIRNQHSAKRNWFSCEVQNLNDNLLPTSLHMIQRWRSSSYTFNIHSSTEVLHIPSKLWIYWRLFWRVSTDDQYVVSIKVSVQKPGIFSLFIPYVLHVLSVWMWWTAFDWEYSFRHFARSDC
jgi:hypothetical protein